MGGAAHRPREHGRQEQSAPPEGTGFECDKMSTAAADVQFDNYIGRLTKPGAPLHGKLRAMLMDSWECKQQTWTPGMDGIFASRLGYDGPTPEAKAFSGTATYETEFDIASIKSGSRMVLDLGRVESIAKITVNGKTFPTAWAPPYNVDVTDALRPGKNHLKVEVTDTWFNRMVYDSGRPEGERRTWAFRRPRKTEPLRDSGLLGPVALHFHF